MVGNSTDTGLPHVPNGLFCRLGTPPQSPPGCLVASDPRRIVQGIPLWRCNEGVHDRCVTTWTPSQRHSRSRSMTRCRCRRVWLRGARGLGSRLRSVMPSWSPWPWWRLCSATPPSGGGCAAPAATSGICSPTSPQVRLQQAPVEHIRAGHAHDPGAGAGHLAVGRRRAGGRLHPGRLWLLTRDRPALGSGRWPEYGYCASHSRYFWGLRLLLVCTLGGLPVLFALTGAKVRFREAEGGAGRASAGA